MSYAFAVVQIKLNLFSLIFSETKIEFQFIVAYLKGKQLAKVSVIPFYRPKLAYNRWKLDNA